MNPNRDLMRLRRFYGYVAADQNRSILRYVTGEKILDLGCGYGTLLRDAKETGKDVLGYDIDFGTLKTAGDLSPSLSAKFAAKSFHVAT